MVGTNAKFLSYRDKKTFDWQRVMQLNTLGFASEPVHVLSWLTAEHMPTGMVLVVALYTSQRILADILENHLEQYEFGCCRGQI